MQRKLIFKFLKPVLTKLVSLSFDYSIYKYNKLNKILINKRLTWKAAEIFHLKKVVTFHTNL